MAPVFCCQMTCWEVPLNRPEGSTPLPCQEIWLKEMELPSPLVRGCEELAVKAIVPDPVNWPEALKGTGLAPVDSPRTAPLPGRPVTGKVTRSMVDPGLPYPQGQGKRARAKTTMTSLVATSRLQAGGGQPQQARLPIMMITSPILPKPLQPIRLTNAKNPFQLRRPGSMI